MDNIKTTPPFFTLPEVLRFLAVAFDTKNKNKPLDEACSRVDTNYRQIESWISRLFEEPLKRHGFLKEKYGTNNDLWPSGISFLS